MIAADVVRLASILSDKGTVVCNASDDVVDVILFCFVLLNVLFSYCSVIMKI